MNYKHTTFSWINSKCVVKQTKIGMGVFAKSDIKKNEKVCVSGGYILRYSAECKSGLHTKDYSLQLDNDFVIGYKKDSELESSCFFNHSCEPNIGIIGQIVFVAMRNIKKGEEITFDYAMTIDKLKGAPRYEMKCECNSKKCRGLVTEDDWKDKVLQDRYAGFFQINIQRKIDRLRR